MSTQRRRWICVSALLLLLIHWTPCAAEAAAAAVNAVSPSISLPDWALRIDTSGHFRLEDLTDTPTDGDASSVERPTRDETLLEWAARYGNEASAASCDALDSSADDASVFLVVGVKTSVLHGFGQRQAIRQTWASPEATPPDVRVVFLGCESDLSMYSALKREQLQRAIELEKRVFGDLLTTELVQCKDSFARLADKVKAYMKWVVEAYPTLAYAMVVDDDLYLRIDLLLRLLRRETTPRTRFFGGNSATNEYRGLSAPVRDPRHKYHLPAANYPMSELPPFVAGCHFLLSRDLAQFIARNFEDLRGLGALDDPSLGLWLYALLLVEPTYLSDFQILRSIKLCSDELVSLADLSTPTICHIHANVVAGRPLCDGFEHMSWIKQVRSIVMRPISEAGTSGEVQDVDNEGDAGFDWDLLHNSTGNRLQIDVRVVAMELSVSFVYMPSLTLVGVGFCSQAATLLQQKLFLTVGEEWCDFHRHVLLASFNETAQNESGMRALLQLTRHNLQRSLIEDATRKSKYESAVAQRTAYTYVDPPPFIVALSDEALALQVLFECLFVALNPESQVLVVHNNEAPDYSTLNAYVATLADTERDMASGGNLQGRSQHLLILEPSIIPENGGVYGSSLWQDPRVFVLAAHEESTRSSKTFHISPASRLFCHTSVYSPAELLRVRPPSQQSSGSNKRFGFFGSWEDVSTLEWLQAHLPEVVRISDKACDFNSQTPPTRFCLDHSVDKLKTFKFVFVQDPTAMVAVFLAGSIPVFYGLQTREVGRLFYPRAFVDCSQVNSLLECVQRVLEIDASPDLEGNLRSGPAIVDEVAFAEEFFWHPDAKDDSLSSAALERQRRLIQGLQACCRR